MNGTESYNTNTIFSNSFLNSKYFDPAYLFEQGQFFFNNIFSFSLNISNDLVNLYYFLLFLFATFFISMISYSVIRVLEIRKKEHHHIEHEIAEYAHRQREREEKARDGESVSNNPRWVQVLNYLFSNNDSDWKLAIIEADSMLDSLMDQLGFRGETLGDKLKMANQENFPSLTKAWEVHNIRNRIAHEGMAFPVSQHEAKRVIALYETIFRGFGFI